MPYINRFPAKKTRWQNSNKRKRNRTDKEKLRVKLYNNSKWKKLRLAYLMEHPLCERCLEKGIINGSKIQCHHKLSPFDDGLTDSERLDRLLSYDNLESICPSCHGLEHFKQQKNDENKSKNQK